MVNTLNRTECSQWLKASLYVTLLIGLLLYGPDAMAGDIHNTDFWSPWANTLNKWITGSYGRTVSLLALLVGGCWAAVSKTWPPLLYGLIVAVGTQLIAGIINAIFT